jgi:yecA family protein
MTPETSLNTAVDWEDLSDFLMSDRAPDTCMRPTELDGFVTGIAVSPDMIPPSDWLPVIWGGSEPEFTSIEEAGRILSLIRHHYSNIRLMLDRTPEAYQPVLLDSSSDWAIAENWARGFFAAVTLRGASWAALLVPEQFGLIVPIAYTGPIRKACRWCRAVRNTSLKSRRGRLASFPPPSSPSISSGKDAGVVLCRRYARRTPDRRQRLAATIPVHAVPERNTSGAVAPEHRRRR